MALLKALYWTLIFIKRPRIWSFYVFDGLIVVRDGLNRLIRDHQWNRAFTLN